MTGTFLIAVLGFPLLLVVMCLGLGLLARAVAGELRAVLVLPIGLAGTYVISTLLTWPPATATLAGPAVAVLAAVGLVIGRAHLRSGLRRLRSREQVGDWLWPALAAFVAFLVVAAPELFSGMPTFSGYGHIVDIAHQFDLGAHLADDGRGIPAGYLATPYHSAYDQVVGGFLETGYPAGGQGLLGALAQLIGIDQAWLWQTFLAVVAAMGAMAAYRLANSVVRLRPLCALAGAIAVQGNLLYGYELAGGIKELSSTVFLLLTAAVLTEGRDVLTPPRRPLLLALPVSAAFASFNLTILPWLAVLLAGVFATMLACALWKRAGRPAMVRLLLGWGEAGIITAALSAASIQVAVKLAPTVSSARSDLGLGNLALPIPAQAASGIWVTDDIRFALQHTGITHVMTVVVLVLGAIGLLAAIWRLRPALAWLAPAGGIALAYVFSGFPPWVEFKAETMTSPIPLLLAFVGAGSLLMAQRLGPARVLGLLGAAAVAGTVLYGNALAYHDTTVAPYERLHELQEIGARFSGDGPTLAPQWDEYSEYFLRTMDAIGLPDLTYLMTLPGVFAPGQTIYTVDTNQLEPSYIQHFAYLVLRRSPTESRPPSDFTLALRTTYYEVWRRTGNPASILAFYPLSGSPAERTPALCSQVESKARTLKATRLAYVVTPPIVQLLPAQFVGSRTLESTGTAFIAVGPARATARFALPSTGRWQIWLGGSIGRPVNVSLDGRQVGDVAYQPSYPGQYAPVTTLPLTAGTHTAELLRGGGSLHPGSGNGIDDTNRTIGPLTLVEGALQAEQPVRQAPIADLPALCSARVGYNWIELLSGPASSRAAG